MMCCLDYEYMRSCLIHSALQENIALMWHRRPLNRHALAKPRQYLLSGYIRSIVGQLMEIDSVLT